jgi:hypothetical protein
MKQIYIFPSYVFDDYLKTCKFLKVPSPNYKHTYGKFYYTVLHVFLIFLLCVQTFSCDFINYFRSLLLYS